MERRFPFFTLRHPQPVVTISHIEFGEELGTADSVEQFSYQRQQVTVLGGNFV